MGMRTRAANSITLLRCADAAGYGAVSFYEEDAVAERLRPRRSLWRAILSVFRTRA